MVDAYKILKSLMKHLTRLITNLGGTQGVDSDHYKQTMNLEAI